MDRLVESNLQKKARREPGLSLLLDDLIDAFFSVYQGFTDIMT